jgi:hypothetical protein
MGCALRHGRHAMPPSRRHPQSSAEAARHSTDLRGQAAPAPAGTPPAPRTPGTGPPRDDKHRTRGGVREVPGQATKDERTHRTVLRERQMSRSTPADTPISSCAGSPTSTSASSRRSAGTDARAFATISSTRPTPAPGPPAAAMVKLRTRPPQCARSITHLTSQGRTTRWPSASSAGAGCSPATPAMRSRTTSRRRRGRARSRRSWSRRSRRE